MFLTYSLSGSCACPIHTCCSSICSILLTVFLNEGLLAKRKLSDKLKAVEKQMEQHNVASMTEAALLGEGYESGKVNASKISSEDSTHYILIQDLKQFQQVCASAV